MSTHLYIYVSNVRTNPLEPHNLVALGVDPQTNDTDIKLETQ